MRKTKTTQVSSYYRSGSSYHTSNSNGKAPTETPKLINDNKSVAKPSEVIKSNTNMSKIVETVNKSKQDDIKISTKPDLEELTKMNPVEKTRILDSWYTKHMKDLFKFSFKEDSCPKFYEGENSYCQYCTNFGECKLRKGVNDDDIEY